VTARATMPDGRHDESIGAVPIEGLKGENRANALMKGETKAKRRVTLSICGLGILDESEVESIAGAQVEPQASPPKLSPSAESVVPHTPDGEIVEAPRNPVLEAYLGAMGNATDLDHLKTLWAKVNEEQKRGNLTLEERANLGDLKEARKRYLARKEPPPPVDASGNEAWGMGHDDPDHQSNP
jgi:hypothetical protein